MPSLLEALKAAQLVDPKKVEREEARRREKLKSDERRAQENCLYRTWTDLEEQERQEKFLRRAAKETTQPASRVGTKQYFDRFKSSR